MNVNCSELREDIDKIKEACNHLYQKTQKATKNGKGKSEIIPLMESAMQATDQTLEKYLDAFFEKNPQLLQVRLSERIEGFKDKDGSETSIYSISPLPNGNILIGGDDGALYEYQKQPDGSYKLSERIKGFKDENGYEENIRAISPLPNGNMLVGGGNGALYEYRKQPDGSYKLGERIEGFKDKDGYETSIYSISPLPSGNMLIGGGDDDDGALYEYRKQPDGSYKLSERIEGFKDKDDNETDINAISPLSNGNMLVGGERGALYEYRKQPDGSYKLGERIEGFKDKDGYETSIYSISPLPNGNMLIGGGDDNDGALYEYQKQPDGSYKLSERIKGFKDENGYEENIRAISPITNGNMLIGGWLALYEYRKQPDGSYKLSERIAGFKDKNGDETFINAISPLSNGNMLVGGGSGTLYEAQIPPRSLDTLKQSLDQIIS